MSEYDTPGALLIGDERLNFEDTMSELRSADDSNRQFAILSSLTGPELGSDGGMADALVDFAADPDSSPSLLVRAHALDLAVALMTDDQLQQVHPFIYGISPKESIDRGKGYPRYTKDEMFELFPSTTYFGAALALANQEGIDPELLFVDGEGPSVYTNNPMAVFLMVEQINYLRGLRYDLPTGKEAGLVALAIDVQLATWMFEEMPRHRLDYIRQDAQQMYEFSQMPEARPYVDKLKELKQTAQKLKDIFPDNYEWQIHDGIQGLIAKSSYALQAHLQNDKNSLVKLPLKGNGDNAVSLSVKEDEPLAILSFLGDAISLLHAQVTDKDTKVTGVVDESEFQIYRLWADGHHNASLYIRPYGAAGFDSSVEYGNRAGVEASISYVVQPHLSSDELLQVGPHDGNGVDDRISIRLDREGFPRGEQLDQPRAKRDPTRENGTLSLDVGSLRGDHKGMGVKTGRLLAWGAMIKAQIHGEDTDFNHVTSHFSKKDGHADVFATAAYKLSEAFEARRLQARQLAGRLGLSELHQAK